MSLLVIIAFLATLGFYRRAKESDLHPGRAASIPFLGAGLMLVFIGLFAMVVRYFGTRFGVSGATIAWNLRVMEVILILAYCYYIKQNWHRIQLQSEKPKEVE